MKKLLVALLIAFLTFSLVSCTFGSINIGIKKNNNDNKQQEPDNKDPDNGNPDEPNEPNEIILPKYTNDYPDGGDSYKIGYGAESTDTFSKTETLSIIEFNDVHGYIMQNSNKMSGLSNAAYTINGIREEVGNDNVLLIANGDMFQGTGLVRMSMGRVIVDAMSAMKFDACCIGNHEFDWGIPQILSYFDGDEANGEATFPLINSNIKQNGKTITIKDGKVYQSYIFNKAGIKVGFIGYIGDVKSSIASMYSKDYEFDTDFETNVLALGGALKDAGADIIVVSIHDGDTSGVENFYVNQILAKVKYNGSYLVDAVINGHTHTYQDGAISRAGGVAMPVVQSNGYASNAFYSYGRIDLTIDTETKKVTGYETSHLTGRQAGVNYDQNVQNVIDKYYNESKTKLEETYCYNANNIGRYDNTTYEWVGNVCVAATGADVFLCNTGGLRTGLSSGNITFEDIYQMNPFDNYIIMYELNATQANKLIDSGNYIVGMGCRRKTTGHYTMAVIDYVYYADYFKNYRSSVDYNTGLIMRDLLIEDLKLRDQIDLSKSTEAIIGLKVNKVTYTKVEVILDYIKQTYAFI